jgi:hypothetical protein
MSNKTALIAHTISNPAALRAIAADPRFVSVENRPAERRQDHKFQTGDRALLVGLESFPEYNGEEVTITNVREDGERGRAYYINGRINQHLNWVYEYRLRRVP